MLNNKNLKAVWKTFRYLSRANIRELQQQANQYDILNLDKEPSRNKLLIECNNPQRWRVTYKMKINHKINYKLGEKMRVWRKEGNPPHLEIKFTFIQ
jgi:hypothetical protein